MEKVQIRLERVRQDFQHYTHIIRIHAMHANGKEYSSQAHRVNTANFKSCFEFLKVSMLDYLANSPEVNFMTISPN